MKILQINAVMTGSTGRTAVEMSRYLNAYGHDCRIAFAEGNIVNYSVRLYN